MAPKETKNNAYAKSIMVWYVIYFSTKAQSVMWQAPDACAQPYHPGSDNHGQLLRLFLDTVKFRK